MTANGILAPDSENFIYSDVFQAHEEGHYYDALVNNEKPSHLEYLKNFRVHQCPLFLQHKCTQHRPFTCFHWHFQNQRRRQPVQKQDKSFNYSPDIYCNQYDETTGTCKKGDDCQFLHRVTGDTERRYHLRYYKTSACIHETDDNRHCEKNGPHCAFGHGHDDLRAPIFDASITSDTAATDMHERLNPDDNKWNDAEFVLSYYKTEACKKQPRFCRQGYACPHYHNAKDRRRNPKKFKYRSTPCPTVKKVGEDWQDPQKCDKGDSCPMCHTRTEQQFHPDIYKSTKCHDMQQTTYCPRGPFCAFAHVEQQEHEQNEDPMRSRTVSDARFELARERRRQQLEQRQMNLRNSVSGGEIRPRASSFRSVTDRSNAWSTGDGAQMVRNGSREAPWTSPVSQSNPKCSPHSPGVVSSPKNFDSPVRNGATKPGVAIRPTQWPPHPDRENEDNEDLWSPDIFRDVTGPLEFHEEENKNGYQGHVVSNIPAAISDEMSRRRTQSASFTSHHSPPPSSELEPIWTNSEKSSPITIGKSFPDRPGPNSFGSAIINNVLGSSVGNGSGSNSWSEDRTQHELNELRHRFRSMEMNYYQMKQQLDYRTNELSKANEQLYDQKMMIRQMEEHNNQIRQDKAKERVILEVRTCMAQRTKCLVPRETIQQLQNQLRQDLEVLERAIQS